MTPQLWLAQGFELIYLGSEYTARYNGEFALARLGDLGVSRPLGLMNEVSGLGF